VDTISDEIMSLLVRTGRSLTITEISSLVHHGRQSTARHLDSLLLSGKVSMCHHGLKKKYYIPRTVPDCAIEYYSAHIQLILKPDLTIIQANDQFLRLVRSQEKTITGVKLGTLINGIINLDSIIKNSLTLAEGQSCQFEEIVSDNDKRHTYEFILSRIKTGRNDAILFLSGKDIEEKKLLEEDLKKSEEKYRTLVNNIPGIVFRVDVNRKVLEFYSQFTEITGYYPELLPAFTFHPLEAAILSDDHDKVRDRIHKALDTDEQYEIEYRILDPYGNTLCLLERGKTVLNEAGKTGFIDGIIFDISDRKLSEEEVIQKNTLLSSINTILVTTSRQLEENNKELLQMQQELIKSKEQFRFLFESAPIGIGISNLNGEVLIANSCMQNLIGYSPDEYQSLSLQDTFADHEERNRLLAILNQQGHARDYEARLIQKGGSHYIALLNCDLISFNNEPAVFTTCRDITERIIAENAQKQLNKQLNLMTTITRHDIVNQINTISVFFEAIKNTTDIRQVDEYLDHIEEVIAHIQSDIEFTRLYQQIGSSPPRWIPLSLILSQLNFPIEIGFQSEIDPIEIYIDALILSVLKAQIDTASLHHMQVRHIRLSSYIEEGIMVITYQDDGTGISPEVREHLFDKDSAGLSGPGLFFIKEILAITEITIIENGTRDSGARFEITVPRDKWRYCAH